MPLVRVPPGARAIDSRPEELRAQLASPEAGELSHLTDGDSEVRERAESGAPPSQATGHLDHPRDGAVIAGDVLEVTGWCLFEGSRVARVEVVVDGVSAGLARPYYARPDIGGLSTHRDATVSGYELLVDFERRYRGAESLVTVEATSLDGQRWRSPTHRVRWVASATEDAGHGELLARESAAVLEKLPRGGAGVLVFTHSLSYGGGELWLLELLRQVKVGSAHDCTVVSPVDGPLRDTLEELGIKVHVTSQYRVDNVEAYEGRIHELALLIRASGAAAVLVNTLGIFPAIDAAARAGVPSLWAIHESFEPAVFRHISWGTTGIDAHVVARFNECFRLTRALIFEARQTADLFAHLCSPEQTFVVDYGVHVDEIDEYRKNLDRSALRAAAGFDEDSVVMVVVGVFQPRKAQAAAIAAFDELAAVHPRLHLVLVGSFSCFYASAVEEQVARCSAPERVQLVPIVPDIYPWYAAADILLCASDVESLPRSILEAMAFELPVVSTDVFGIADLIDDGWTGWLTRSRDLEAVVGVLHLVLRMPDTARREVGARAKAEVLRRHGDYSYGRIFAGVLDRLVEDPACDLTPVFMQAEALEMAS